MLLTLTGQGLTLVEARELSFEDMACFLHHAGHQQQLDGLGREADRIASLPFADQSEQVRLLRAIQLTAGAREDSFHRQRRTTPRGKDNE